MTLFAVVSVLLATNVAPSERNSHIFDAQDSGGILASGIKFNLGTEILLAEKFINVDVLVPLPKFEMNMSAELGAFINKLASLWDFSRWQGHLDYPAIIQRNDSTFDIDWLLHQFENEVTLEEEELGASSLLNKIVAAAQARNWKLWAAPHAKLASASVGLFRSGIALGTGRCGLGGIFGSWHDC